MFSDFPGFRTSRLNARACLLFLDSGNEVERGLGKQHAEPRGVLDRGRLLEGLQQRAQAQPGERPGKLRCHSLAAYPHDGRDLDTGQGPRASHRASPVDACSAHHKGMGRHVPPPFFFFTSEEA